jgi:FtsZ-binding cell division protein ZapB
MTTDTEVASTGSETASEEGQVATEAQATPEGVPAAEAAATESKPELQPSAEAEEDAKVKAALDAQFGEAVPAAEESDKVTLSKVELEERERRAAQSAADRAAEEVRRENQRVQEQAQSRGRIRADMHRDISEAVKKAVESGEPTDAFIRDIDQRYGRALYEEANEYVSTTIDNAAIQALSALPGMDKLTDEDTAPLARPMRTPVDRFAAMFEIAVAQTRKQVKAEMEDWAEKEANKRARAKSEAALKQIRAEERGAQTGGELPKGEATGQGPTDADVSAHRGDLVWWNANKEAYFRRIGAAKK